LEIFNTGGASSALSRYNKYDESAEALQYYHLLAIGSRSHDPDIFAAHTLASYYYRGLRGVKQDPRKSLKYLEICAEYHDKECAGQAGLMHVWGIGMTPEERNLSKAYDYFILGTTGKLDYCIEQWRRRKKQNSNNAGFEGEVELCDKHSVTGLGLLNLFGVDGLIDRNVNMARSWLEHGKDLEDSESMYNYAMLHLGWMVSELHDLPTNITVVNTVDDKHAGSSDQHASVFDRNYMTHRNAPADPNDGDKYTGPSVSDYNIAIQQLRAAAKNGHLQAKHKLGMLYASGATVPRKNGRPTIVVQQSCPSALRYFKSVAENGHTFSRRNRAAWKQYMAGDYESSLRNYLASAETGSEVGQVNAAFLLEQGVCLGMTATACTHASVRLWRAAARQGNLEACLRVGDFYYYGRMMKSRGQFKRDFASGETATVYDREEYLSLVISKTFYFVPGPYRWMRYVLYPEELFHLTNEWLSLSLRNLWQYTMSIIFHGEPGDNQETSLLTSQNACSDETEGICLPHWVSNNGDDVIDRKAEKHDHTTAKQPRITSRPVLTLIWGLCMSGV
jgi:TPR repeat protein